MTAVLNVSAYRFVPLDEFGALRESLQTRASADGLLGTVLLAPEGINLFLAGEPPRVRGFLDWLRQDPRFEGLDAKESVSPSVPFKRLLVKVKREIIRMNQPDIRPDLSRRAPAIPPQTLSRWLDQGHDDNGREVVLLDTRNDFEVDLGRFRGAVDWRLGRFSDFPQAVAHHAAGLAGKTVVTYCTGGIRCEKAALHLRAHGIDGVLQLEGGILRYFEHVGRAHYDGTCFVFDQREQVGHDLAPPTAEAVPQP